MADLKIFKGTVQIIKNGVGMQSMPVEIRTDNFVSAKRLLEAQYPPPNYRVYGIHESH